MKIYQQHQHPKPNISQFKPHWTSGIDRRAFIKGTVAASLLASIAACKPTADNGNISQQPLINQSANIVSLSNYTFSQQQHIDLLAVYMRLFPDDGDGPGAKDLNVLTYLEWAMTDAKNQADGDAEFIKKGLGWLNQYADDEYGKDFHALDDKKQDQLIAATAQSDAGGKWISILVYYLIEALTLDPFYGGNTDGIGWQWLQHQGGFPQPIAGKTYRDFE